MKGEKTMSGLTLFSDFDRVFDSFFTPVRNYGRTITSGTYDDGEKKTWYVNGMIHREDGPAVVYHDEGKKSEYWLKGKLLSKRDWEDEVDRIEGEREHTVYIDGHKHTVKGKNLRKIKELLE